MTIAQVAANVPGIWKDAGSEAARWWNTERPLAHPLDSGEEGLAMKATQCTVDGCETTLHARGLCLKHYTRLKRTGTTRKRQKPTSDQNLARFMTKVTVLGELDCWPWRGTILSSGYGQFSADRKRYLAHRYAYEVFVSPIPSGLQIDHVRARGCGRRDCVNPAHLEAVTPRVNTMRSDNPTALNAQKIRCPRGHDYEFSKNGKRFCRVCRHRKREAA